MNTNDLPGQSTLEMTFESAQFDADLFALASNQTFGKGTVKVFDTFEVTVGAENTVQLETPYAVKGSGAGENPPTLSINGLEAGDTAAAGIYTVGDSAQAQEGEAFKTLLTFAAGDSLAGKTIEVYIERNVDEVDNIIVDNTQTFVGECILRWPVYSSGDEDGLSAGGVKGYIYWRFFKCRVTSAPGFDTSYKYLWFLV